MTIPREAEPQVHLRTYINVVRKHRWLVTGISLVTVITVAIWTFSQVPLFQATATVLIEPDVPKILNIQEVTPISSSNQDYYQTQYAIIKGRPIAEHVIETLNLKARIPELGSTGALLGSISVEPRRGTRLVFVKFEHRDPGVAAEMANAVSHAYVKYNLDLKRKGSREALAWLNDQMAGLRAKVQESSVALQNYRVKAGILGLEEQRVINLRKITDFNSQYTAMQGQRISAEAKLREVTRIAKDKSVAQALAAVANAPLMERLKNEAADLEGQRSRLLKTYKEKHPEILKIDAQLQHVHRKFDAEVQTMLRSVQAEYDLSKAREESLLRNVTQLKQEAQELNEKEIGYLTLQRERDSSQQLFEAVLKRLKETGVSGGLETNNVHVYEEAQIPQSPVKPDKARNLMLSLVIGLVAGLGAAFGIEYFDTTVKSPEDIERYLGLPVIGVVPMFGAKR